MINKQLFHLYASRIQGIKALYADLDAKDIKDYVGPLLPYCWEERRTRQTLWEECTDANPKLSLNDT